VEYCKVAPENYTAFCDPARPRLGAVLFTVFDSAIVPCNDVAMPDRNLKIARLIGSTPSVAYCDLCRLIFKTRQEFLVDSEKALQQLQADFDKHECKPEPGAVNSALDDIR
jgi:heterodisulfide reductase subunit B